MNKDCFYTSGLLNCKILTNKYFMEINFNDVLSIWIYICLNPFKLSYSIKLIDNKLSLLKIPGMLLKI